MHAYSLKYYRHSVALRENAQGKKYSISWKFNNDYLYIVISIAAVLNNVFRTSVIIGNYKTKLVSFLKPRRVDEYGTRDKGGTWAEFQRHAKI